MKAGLIPVPGWTDEVMVQPAGSIAVTVYQLPTTSINVHFWQLDRMLLSLVCNVADYGTVPNPDSALLHHATAFLIGQMMGYTSMDVMGPTLASFPQDGTIKLRTSLKHIYDALGGSRFASSCFLALQEAIEDYSAERAQRRFLVTLHEPHNPERVYMTMSVRQLSDHLAEHRHIMLSVRTLLEPLIAPCYRQYAPPPVPKRLAMFMHHVALLMLAKELPAVNELKVEPLPSMYGILQQNGFAPAGVAAQQGAAYVVTLRGADFERLRGFRESLAQVTFGTANVQGLIHDLAPMHIAGRPGSPDPPSPRRPGMRRYLGGDSDLEEEEDGDEEDAFQGSPMQLSRGTATPTSEFPVSPWGGRNVPWITDDENQDIMPRGRGSRNENARPDWMTRSQDLAPPAPTPSKPAEPKRRLVFAHEDDDDEQQQQPPQPKSPDLFDRPAWDDVDFTRLAREQAAQADRLSKPRPSEKFLSVEMEHAAIGTRLERVLANIVGREPLTPVAVIYAAEPDLDRSKQPLMLWRSSPAAATNVILNMAVIDHYGQKRLDTTLALAGPASVRLAWLDLFSDQQSLVHFQLRSEHEVWLLEAGTRHPDKRVIVILIQENNMQAPQMLDLQPLRFDQEAITDVVVGTMIDDDEEAGWRLEYVKTGGIAGVHEETTVWEDGTVKYWDGRRSRITPAKARQLYEWAMKSRKAPPTPCCDFFSYHVTIRDARGKPIMAQKKVEAMPLDDTE